MTGVWTGWEDWDNGLYLPAFTDLHVEDSVALLTDPDRFAETAAEMIREWPVSARHNLAALDTGRNAWVGQASCLYSHGSPGAATRQAWAVLSDTQRRDANTVASGVRERWEEQDAQALF